MHFTRVIISAGMACIIFNNTHYNAMLYLYFFYIKHPSSRSKHLKIARQPLFFAIIARFSYPVTHGARGQIQKYSKLNGEKTNQVVKAIELHILDGLKKSSK